MCFLDKYFGPAPAMVRKTGNKQRRKVAGRQSSGKQPASKPAGLHTYIVQKAYCCPAWPIIDKIREIYHVPISNYSERTINVSGAELSKIPHKEIAYADVPFATEATFDVPESMAENGWVEYLLWSTGRLIVTGGNIDKRNQQLGEKRAGVMPMPWDAKASTQRVAKIATKPSDGPWLEKECKAGQAMWQEAKLNMDKKRQQK